jgi:hypothetical protein
MDSRKMQAIGICRFSYPAVGGFQIEHDTVEARETFLYDPVRLVERFRYFETFTLPSLQAQTDPDFTFLVVIGENLPTPWKERLMDNLSSLPQAVVQAHPPGPHREVMKEAILSVRESRGEPTLQFRMDDDDAVSIHFTQRLRQAANDCAALLDQHRHVAFDFSQGFVARPGPQGIEAGQVIEHLWTPALAMTAPPRSGTTILSFSHTRMGRFMPVVSLPKEDMYVRGHSDMNDSRQGPNVRRFSLERLDNDGEQYFRDTFAIDADKVRAAFSGT